MAEKRGININKRCIEIFTMHLPEMQGAEDKHQQELY